MSRRYERLAPGAVHLYNRSGVLWGAGQDREILVLELPGRGGWPRDPAQARVVVRTRMGLRPGSGCWVWGDEPPTVLVFHGPEPRPACVELEAVVGMTQYCDHNSGMGPEHSDSYPGKVMVRGILALAHPD